MQYNHLDDVPHSIRASLKPHASPTPSHYSIVTASPPQSRQPDDQQYVQERPFGLFLKVLGHCVAYFSRQHRIAALTVTRPRIETEQHISPLHYLKMTSTLAGDKEEIWRQAGKMSAD